MDLSVYENKLPYPKRPSKPNLISDCIDPELIRTHAIAIESYLKYIDAYNKQKTEYRDEEHRLYHQFKTDLFRYLDISHHPKREALFDKAWSYGHADGYDSVLAYAEEMSELLN